jgi:hypothetical protein
MVDSVRILFDTNILIFREDDHILSSDIQELQQLLNKLKVTTLIHPLSITDLENDKDVIRKEKIRSKIKAYICLEDYPDPSADEKYLSALGEEIRKNDIVDTAILYSIYKNAADFLVTEDRGIHRKAKKLVLEDRVLLIADALQVLRSYLPKEEITSPPALNKTAVHNLDLTDPIFDSLKREYSEFDRWFDKISREGRECWVYYRYSLDGRKNIGALLIYKEEEEAIDSSPFLPKARRLKISTFKVTYIGHKIGELFIKISIDYCIQNDIASLYLTHFTQENDPLVDLITQYGFKKAATNSSGEDIYLKNLIITSEELVSLSPAEISQQFYPNFYEGRDVKKFVIPIYPKFHDRLFTDFSTRIPTEVETSGDFLTEGNAITKAYLSKSQIKKLESGDLILFYRTSPDQILTSLGVIESVYLKMDDTDDIMTIVAKRTVFSREEIEAMKKPLLIILFRHHFHLNYYLTLDELLKMGILAGAPQSISEITHENYLLIKEKGGIDGRYTFD